MNRYWILLLLLFSTIYLYAQIPDTALKGYTQQIPGTSLSFRMVPIPGGSFNLGSSRSDKNASADEGPQKRVQISSFWMDASEVTYEEFEAFMQDEATSQNSKVDAVTRPSPPYIDLTLGMGKSAGFPANSMQQYGALMYCRWLYLKTGISHRLPTAAEWEYACRAGSQSNYPFGEDNKKLPSYAWFKENSDGHYHKVAQLEPNAWGLYDMLGNVAEWTLDQYDSAYFANISESDPLIKPSSRHPRTVRGGSYRDEAVDLRVSNRLKSDPVWNRRDPQIPKSRWWNADAPFVGFRVVRPMKQPSPDEVDAFFKTYLGQ